MPWFPLWGRRGGFMPHFNAFEKIKSLNPEKDYWEIVRLSAMYEFAWDYARSLELALFRLCFAIHFSHLGQKQGV